jgi:hypothetical protein
MGSSTCPWQGTCSPRWADAPPDHPRDPDGPVGECRSVFASGLLPSPPMTTQCQYPNCRQVAATIVVIERDSVSIERFLCNSHRVHAQEIAKQHQGIGYRLRST